MKDKKGFYESYLKNNTYLAGSNKPQPNAIKQKIPKSSTEEFLSSLEKSVQHFSFQRKNTTNTLSTERQPTVEDEFNEKMIMSQFPKTDREPEIKQQRKILSLYQRIYQLNHDINELKYTNSDLIGEIQIQKKHIKGHKAIKDDLDSQKQKWEKRISVLKETIENNKQLMKQLKPIVNLALEDLDHQALQKARKEISLQKNHTITQSQSLPVMQISKQSSKRKLK